MLLWCGLSLFVSACVQDALDIMPDDFETSTTGTAGDVTDEDDDDAELDSSSDSSSGGEPEPGASVVWDRGFPKKGTDNSARILDLAVSDAGRIYVAAARVNPDDVESLVVIAYDDAGEELWRNVLRNRDAFGAASLSADGDNVAVVATVDDWPDDMSTLAFVLDAEGKPLFSTTMPGEEPEAVGAALRGNTLAVSRSGTFGGGTFPEPAFVIERYEIGEDEPRWSWKRVREDTFQAFGFDVLFLPGGDLVATGGFDSEPWVARVELDGTTIYEGRGAGVVPVFGTYTVSVHDRRLYFFDGTDVVVTNFDLEQVDSFAMEGFELARSGLRWQDGQLAVGAEFDRWDEHGASVHGPDGEQIWSFAVPKLDDVSGFEVGPLAAWLPGGDLVVAGTNGWNDDQRIITLRVTPQD